MNLRRFRAALCSGRGGDLWEEGNVVTYGYIHIRIDTYKRDKMALDKRVEVLFDKEKFTYLKQKAKEEKTSVGNLIREAVATVCLEKEVDKRRGALKRILEMEPVDFGSDWAETSWEDFEEQMEEERYRDTIGGK